MRGYYLFIDYISTGLIDFIHSLFFILLMQVHLIHELAWAGTPHEGAAWLRSQKLVDIWHRILLIPVVGGVVVGMFHTVIEIVDMIRGAQPSPAARARRSRIDWLAGIKPFIKALQAALTLGTGLSLGPEGPSVDIGTSWAHGFSSIMKHSKERRIALVAAGAAAGIASGLKVFFKKYLNHETFNIGLL